MDLKNDFEKIDMNLVNKLRDMNFDAKNGLPEELFLYISSLTPIPNVDLLITNDKNQILLSWRDDQYFGKGWHIPGGCIRFGETMIERVQKTAQKEIGTEVEVNLEPLIIKDVICEKREVCTYFNERRHHIAILYECKLPKGFCINNENKKDDEQGFLKWFDILPENILSVHGVYDKILKKWKREEKNEELEQ